MVVVSSLLEYGRQFTAYLTIEYADCWYNTDRRWVVTLLLP